MVFFLLLYTPHKYVFRKFHIHVLAEPTTPHQKHHDKNIHSKYSIWQASERLGQDRDSRWGHATSGALAFGAYVIEHLYYTICIELCDNKLLEGTEAVTCDASGSNAIRGLDGSGRSALLLLSIIMIFDI
ncbi:hypothetical protein PVAP13_5KG593714 [Panicum virgatum]|uniref:Uncharacterized protein n=1 Tax=Panicum virgatum TaxID=38727 RepID=A0A8T0SZH7_PANVG|nr:hypothetical protein PVAP13_5KG593714 [Panicum virgatum]